VVEVDPAIRTRVVRALRRALYPNGGRDVFRVRAASSAASALEQFRKEGAGLVVCGNVGPEEDVRALHEAISAEAGSRVTPITWVVPASGANTRETDAR
jgi:hypothetical protein